MPPGAAAAGADGWSPPVAGRDDGGGSATANAGVGVTVGPGVAEAAVGRARVSGPSPECVLASWLLFRPESAGGKRDEASVGARSKAATRTSPANAAAVRDANRPGVGARFCEGREAAFTHSLPVDTDFTLLFFVLCEFAISAASIDNAAIIARDTQKAEIRPLIARAILRKQDGFSSGAVAVYAL